MQDADFGKLVATTYKILLKQCLGFKTQQNAIRQLQFTAICLTQVYKSERRYHEEYNLLYTS